MSNNSNIDDKSINTLNTLNKSSIKTSEKDTIPMRIEFIKNLLQGTELNPIVNLDETATENFIGNIMMVKVVIHKIPELF